MDTKLFDMEVLVIIGWVMLIAIHAMPSLVVFAPSMAAKLYNVDPAGDIGVLLVHRGAMFLTVVVVSLIAIFDPSIRWLASIVVAISLVSFLIVYARAGMPAGPLRPIAIVDLVGVVPLVFVSVLAWKVQS